MQQTAYEMRTLLESRRVLFRSQKFFGRGRKFDRIDLALQDGVSLAEELLRSEERRVGKECRSGWSRCISSKNYYEISMRAAGVESSKKETMIQSRMCE